jgi:acyl-CoA synthetase (AMP-forming)/AMP-acid ligase II
LPSQPSPSSSHYDNVATLISRSAESFPNEIAIADPVVQRGRAVDYRQISFAELDADVNRLASGLLTSGFEPGQRVVLLVKPGIDFVALVFAMFKAGLTIVLIDPGMGRKNLIRCLAESQPQGFIGIPAAMAVRTMLRHKFPDAHRNVTVGKRWFWGGHTLEQVRRRGAESTPPAINDLSAKAAIIFTTGSTGPPKGVLYSHQNFLKQAEEIPHRYGVQSGEIDLPGFPLFALFNAGMGVTTVFPVMDFTRPADVHPPNIIDPVNQFGITQAFGSPALWTTVGRYCEKHNQKMPSLKRVLSAGAPVPPHVLHRLRSAIASDGEIHTPYGCTEALPVASIESREVLAETAIQTADGKGVCVGKKFDGIEWKVIKIADGPLKLMEQTEAVSQGEIGELMVRGDVVTREYVTRTDANSLHKVRDGDDIWHRIGDLGYLDEANRFWFCGRKSHRVIVASTDKESNETTVTRYTVCCEAILNEHPRVYRTALVGCRTKRGVVPALIVELWPEHRCKNIRDEHTLTAELRTLVDGHPNTAGIRHILIHPNMPTDIRHNAKIFREKLALWAKSKVTRAVATSTV